MTSRDVEMRHRHRRVLAPPREGTTARYRLTARLTVSDGKFRVDFYERRKGVPVRTGKLHPARSLSSAHQL